jgi:hypothetical protein
MQAGCRETARRLHLRAEGGLSTAEAGALDAHLSTCGACREAASALTWAEGELRKGLALPPGLAGRIVGRVAQGEVARPAPRRAFPAAWGAWALLPAAAVVALVVLVVGSRLQTSGPESASGPTAPPRVRVELELGKVEAHTVAVAGDFNQWEAERSAMTRGADGVWRIRLELPPGRYQYVFVIDGERWIADPQASTVVDSGFSGANSVLDVSL